MSTLTVTQNEWFAARSAVLAASPSETDPNHGVAVIAAGGYRWWTAWTDDVVVATVTFTDSDDLEVSMLVSPRLVMAAAHLSQESDDEVTLDLSRGRATISTSDVLLTLDAPARHEIPSASPAVGDVAHSELRAGDLYRLFDVAGILPAGIDPAEVEMPEFVLQIWESGLGAWADWSDSGIPATRLDVAASTTGEARTTVYPNLALRVVGQTNADDDVSVVIPDSGERVTIQTRTFTAHIKSHLPANSGQTVEEFLQLAVFDPDAYLGGGFVDPYAGWSLTDIRALAMDPDPEVRARATMSRWNWDNRVQVQFATDPDESVVLALLDNVDPGMDATTAIMEGPHVNARRVLAGRNLTSELLLRFLGDDDHLTSESARNTLVARGFSLKTPAGIEHS